MSRKKSYEATTKEEREAQRQKQLERMKLFEIFMVELGKWKIVNWQVTDTDMYLSAEDAEKQFKIWLLKNK